jgi:hypothetical protein
MYKLGPVHEGKLERGCKTGSFSYLMWPCRVGPFSVVLGKHTRTFDTVDFPFSHLQATEDGRCAMVPGLYLTTVGTVRDGAKWPQRDRRQGAIRRDRISFDVFSPLTVGRMIHGSARLQELQNSTDRSVENVNIEGADVKRILLRTAQKYYRTGIQMYLLDKVVSRVEDKLDASGSLSDAMAAAADAAEPCDWLDIGGQMMPRRRLDDLSAAIEDGTIGDKSALDAQLNAIVDAYAEDEWRWVKDAYREVFDVDLDQAGVERFVEAADSLLAVRGKFLKLVENDAAKEFEDLTQTGFGQDATEDQVAIDFAAVRGECDENSFIRQLRESRAALEDRIAKLKQTLEAL